MPYCFQFLRDNNAVSLDEVDREVAEYAKQPYSKENYCIAYQVLTMLAMSIANKAGNGPITKDLCRDIITAQYPPEEVEEMTDFLYTFLVDRFQYLAWYGR